MFLKKKKKRSEEEERKKHSKALEAAWLAQAAGGWPRGGLLRLGSLTPSHPGRGAQGKRDSRGPVRVEGLQRGPCPLD